MKSSYIINVAIIATMLCFSSCKNAPVEIVRDDTQVNFILNNVLPTFTTYSAEELEMYVQQGIASQIMVKAFVYDDNGKLIDQFSKKIDDYNQTVAPFSVKITGYNNTLVCFTYGTWTNSSGKETNAYVVTGEQLLSSLKVEVSTATSLYNCIPWQVLGGAIVPIGIFDDAIDVDVRPLGGLAYMDFENIHAHSIGSSNSAKNPTKYTFMQKFNDIVTIKDGTFSYSCSLSSTYWYFCSIYPAQHQNYNGVFISRFMMPGQVQSYCYGSYSPSNDSSYDDEVETGRSSTQTTEVKAEKQYVFEMDCNDYTQRIKEGVLEDKSSLVQVADGQIHSKAIK
ncbi:MAG: hypothetical protein II829_03220 [Bacteroidales bacterium]|nr:hypothetical protein [Bacteroidales bacterium]MBQ4398581.1 hypothetical protein [Bacteroidales bacterium]